MHIYRQLGQYKGFCSNRRYAESSIAEAYIAHECVTYCHMYLQPENDNSETMHDASQFNLSVVATCVNASGGVFPRSFKLTNKEVVEAQWCVLLHCTEVDYFRNRHLQFVCSGDHALNKRDFPDYFLPWECFFLTLHYLHYIYMSLEN